MKIGFIGLGNMAEAMIGGLLKKQIVKADDIVASARTAATRQKMKGKFQISVLDTNIQVAEQADILFFAIKPAVLQEVLAEVKDVLREDTLLVSIAAGKTISFFEEALGGETRKLVRCMPNTPALVLEGCTGVCANSNVTEEELELVLKLLRAFGTAQVVPEKLMDVVVGVSGSSPAYVFMFIEAMADAAVLKGMPRALAYEFAAQAVLGSAKLVLETKEHPGALKDMVCSPGGTTIEAVKVLEQQGFRGAVIEAIEACVEKSKNL